LITLKNLICVLMFQCSRKQHHWYKNTLASEGKLVESYYTHTMYLSNEQMKTNLDLRGANTLPEYLWTVFNSYDWVWCMWWRQKYYGKRRNAPSFKGNLEQYSSIVTTYIFANEEYFEMKAESIGWLIRGNWAKLSIINLRFTCII
jgi:hypothetical protein